MIDTYESGFGRYKYSVQRKIGCNCFYLLLDETDLPWAVSLALFIIFKSKDIILILFFINWTLSCFTAVVNVITICS